MCFRYIIFSCFLFKLHEYVREVISLVLGDDLYLDNTKCNTKQEPSIIEDPNDDNFRSEYDNDFSSSHNTCLSESSEEDVKDLKVLVELTTGKHVRTVHDSSTHEIKTDEKHLSDGTHSEDYKQFLRDSLPGANLGVGKGLRKKVKTKKNKVKAATKTEQRDKKRDKKKPMT